LKQRKSGGEDDYDFFGAMCMDIDPSGPLDDYFPFDEQERATYLMFNSDQAFESITEIEESQFNELV